MWYVRPAKHQISLRVSLEYFTIVKLLTEHNLEYLNFKEGCIDLSESTLVKMTNC